MNTTSRPPYLTADASYLEDYTMGSAMRKALSRVEAHRVATTDQVFSTGLTQAVKEPGVPDNYLGVWASRQLFEPGLEHLPIRPYEEKPPQQQTAPIVKQYKAY